MYFQARSAASEKPDLMELGMPSRREMILVSLRFKHLVDDSFILFILIEVLFTSPVTMVAVTYDTQCHLVL